MRPTPLPLLIDTQHCLLFHIPLMEVDATYQGCLPSCELHSRSLSVGHTGTCDPEIAHVLHNLEIAQIPRLHGTYMCNEDIPGPHILSDFPTIQYFNYRNACLLHYILNPASSTHNLPISPSLTQTEWLECVAPFMC